LDSMEKQLHSKEWKQLRATAHKMKPSFSFMGIKELQDVIISIEEYSDKEIKLELLPELINKLKNISNKAIEELKKEKDLII